MRRLLLLRHAESDRPAGIADLGRPLAPEGREAARRMGRYLAVEQLWPDFVLVSPARRTRETWDLVRPALGDPAVHVEPRLYEAPAERLVTVLHEVETEMRSVLMIGHNPGLADLARLLVGQGDRYAFARMAQGFPSAGLAVIDVAAEDWRQAAPRAGRLDRFVTPDSIPADASE